MPSARATGSRGFFAAAALALALGASVLFAAGGTVTTRVPPRSVLTAPDLEFSEPSAAIHPKLPRRLLAAAIQRSNPSRVAVASSLDGGATWRGVVLPLSPGDINHVDPYVAWSADGKAWVGVIAITPEGSRFRVFRSANNGQTWVLDGTPSASQIADRSAIWADASAASPYRGTLYANWHTDGIPYLSRRKASGGWSPPLKLSGTEKKGYAQGGDVRTDPAGTVYVFWPDNGNPGPASNNIYVAQSLNGGVKFAKPVKVAALHPGFSFLFTPSFSNTRLVAPAADRRGPQKLAYVAWMDVSGGQACTDSITDGLLRLTASSACETRIWFSRSTDGGKRWSARRALFDRPEGNDQFNPSLAVDPSTGILFATYHDTAGDPARVQTHLSLQMSKDRGATWSAPVRITEQPSSGIWYGHYEGLAASGGTLLPVWSSTTAGRAETWMSVLAPQL